MPPARCRRRWRRSSRRCALASTASSVRAATRAPSSPGPGSAPAGERRLAVDHLPLRPQDWNAGNSKWVIDLVAPFGHVDQLLRILARNRTETRLRTLWHNRAGTRYRVVEWTRPEPGAAISVTSYGAGQFARLLDGRA